MSKIIEGLLALTFLSSCTLLSAPQDKIEPPKPLYTARGEMLIELDGVVYPGMTATTITAPLKIKATSKATFNHLIIDSCHRSISMPLSGKVMTYTFEATETEKRCMSGLYIQALEDKGVTDWGYIAFRSFEDLPAKLECNGVKWSFKGYSVCQAKATTIQKIEFDVPIRAFRADPSCNILKLSDRAFEVRPSLGECTMAFEANGKRHSSMFIGYERQLVR